jgi:hypothetical protein
VGASDPWSVLRKAMSSRRSDALGTRIGIVVAGTTWAGDARKRSSVRASHVRAEARIAGE